MLAPFLVRLAASPRKRVELEQIKQMYFELYPEVQNHPERGSLLLDALQALADSGAIVLPARASWEKIGQPALPKWIKLVREQDETPTDDFSKVPWVPELGFWTELKPAQLIAAKTINEFLLRRRGGLLRVPIKERSLEIFGDEKRLDAMRLGNTLFSGRLSLDTLGAFVVPLPLPYRSASAPGKPLLVVENHNSYWSFGEWNQLARRYSAVVYGAGEAFRSTGAALGQVLHEVKGSTVLYLGDLDPKGIGIPLDFNRSSASDEPKVGPAAEWYEWLLSHGLRREKVVCTSAPPATCRRLARREFGQEGCSAVASWELDSTGGLGVRATAHSPVRAITDALPGRRRTPSTCPRAVGPGPCPKESARYPALRHAS